MKIKFHTPYEQAERFYDPETEGYFIVRFKEGVTQRDLWIPPLPSRQFVQLAFGWVGNPRSTMEEAQRDLCVCLARWPHVAGLIEICKCPIALAERESFVSLCETPNPVILEQAKDLYRFPEPTWYSKDAYHRGTGRFSLNVAKLAA